MFELRKNNLICISIFVLLLKAVCIFAAVGDIVTVFLENGTEVRGLEQHTIYENRVYSAFKGIPFAEPPIEVLRFKVGEFKCFVNIPINQKQFKIHY